MDKSKAADWAARIIAKLLAAVIVWYVESESELCKREEKPNDQKEEYETCRRK